MNPWTRFLSLIAALAVVIVLAACDQDAVGPDGIAERGIDSELEPAVTGSEPDGDKHPNVGLLAFDVDGPEGALPPFGFCAGFVVSDRVFVTAAHCVEAGFIPEGSSFAVTLEPGSPEDPVYPPTVPGAPPQPLPVLVPVLYASDVVVHPDFDPGTREHDVAVLLFSEGTFDGVKPVRLPRERWLDKFGGRGQPRGPVYTIVGYGGTDNEEGLLFGPGYRQSAKSPFHSLDPFFLFVDIGRGGSCAGDSGGPYFHGNSDMVVSLVSGGGCGFVPSRSHRLDLPSVLDFLEPFLDG